MINGWLNQKRLRCLFRAAQLAVVLAAADAGQGVTGSAIAPLHVEIAALDDAVFGAFNACNQPGQLQLHASFFAADVEFYHDTGGVTWNRDDMIANTKKYVCGNFRRELVANSLSVFPIKDFGAIEQGVHRFCQLKTGNCEGMADFVIVWRKQQDKWQITRVLSYGHRPTL